jgi:hypothetical protein
MEKMDQKNRLFCLTFKDNTKSELNQFLGAVLVKASSPAFAYLKTCSLEDMKKYCTMTVNTKKQISIHYKEYPMDILKDKGHLNKLLHETFLINNGYQ